MIDLSKLPPPDAVEPLDYESILAELKTDFQARWPDFSSLLESDPAIKLLEVAAYRELLLRQRINDAARAVMLATATGADLDNLAALLGVARLDGESDDAFRHRAVASLQALSVAGPAGAYRALALGAHPDVKDAYVHSPAPGHVRVVVLSSAGDGAPAQAVLDAVTAALSAETARPLCDTVEVTGAQIVSYPVQLALTVEPGPDAEAVRAAAEDAVAAWAAKMHRLGGGKVSPLALAAAAWVEGVADVSVLSPVDVILLSPEQAAYAASIEVAVANA